MFDICLNQTFNNPPAMSDLLQEIPILADPAFQHRLFPRATIPGLLGLELPKDLAKRLLQRFLAAGSNGYYFPAAYHHPRLTIEQATFIAAQAIDKLRLKCDPTDLFQIRKMLDWYPSIEKEEKLFEPELTTNVLDAIFLYSAYPCYWEFGALSARMTKERRFPNGIFTCVDKLDGHVWQPEELNRLREGRLFDE